MSDDARLEKGRAFLAEVFPGFEENVTENFGALAPGMAQNVIASTYGEHYANPAVDARTRFLAAIAAIVAMGGDNAHQLKFKMRGALKCGATREEIAAIVWQTSVYGGMPNAVNGLNTTRELFAELDAEDAPA